MPGRMRSPFKELQQGLINYEIRVAGLAIAGPMSGFYELSPYDRNGNAFPFSKLQGKVVLIVNVASKCGFTPQYKELEELYEKYKDQGLIILGFPCNQFGAQEPGTNEQIGEFCRINFGVTFPILRKVDVNGVDASPVYEYLKSKRAGILGFRGIRWNFEKFLVNKQGEVVDRFPSLVKPASLEPAIVGLLHLEEAKLSS